MPPEEPDMRETIDQTRTATDETLKRIHDATRSMQSTSDNARKIIDDSRAILGSEPRATIAPQPAAD